MHDYRLAPRVDRAAFDEAFRSRESTSLSLWRRSPLFTASDEAFLSIAIDRGHYARAASILNAVVARSLGVPAWLFDPADRAAPPPAAGEASKRRRLE